MLKGLTLSLAILIWPTTQLLAQTCSTYPNSLTNGTTADATQVMANFNCAALTGAPVFSGNAIFNAAVGIGTTTPGASLTIVSTGNTTSPYVTVLPQNLTQSVNISYNHMFEGGSNGNNSIYIDAQGSGSVDLQAFGGTGNVGIKTNSPSYNFYVNGSSGGTQAWANASDARLKMNVRPIPNALDLVQRLVGVSFEWRPAETREVGKTLDLPLGQRQLGFIAQEVEKVVPEAVIKPQSPEGAYGMRDGSLVALLVQAVKEQQTEIQELKSKLATLAANR